MPAFARTAVPHEDDPVGALSAQSRRPPNTRSPRRPGRDHLATGGRHHPGIPGRNHPVLDERLHRNRQTILRRTRLLIVADAYLLGNRSKARVSPTGYAFPSVKWDKGRNDPGKQSFQRCRGRARRERPVVRSCCHARRGPDPSSPRSRLPLRARSLRHGPPRLPLWLPVAVYNYYGYRPGAVAGGVVDAAGAMAVGIVGAAAGLAGGILGSPYGYYPGYVYYPAW